MRRLLYIVAFGFWWLPSGCTPDDVFVPPPVYSFISDSDLAEINDRGMPIYVGSTPPYSMGRFALDSLEITFDAAGNTGTIGPHEITIDDDGYDFNVTICEYANDSSSSACSVKAYISGQVDCFTIYSTNAGRSGRCEHEDIAIYSGCFDAEGHMTNFHKAFFSTSHAGDCAGRPAIGYLQIQAEMDGFSEWIE